MVKRREQYPLPEGFEVARSYIDLPAYRLTVTGLEWFVPRNERREQLTGEYMIRTEPKNKVDENAVAVFVGRRQIGYLRSEQGARYSPLLQRIGDSLAVRGDQVEDEFAVHVPGSRLLKKLLDWGPVPSASGQEQSGHGRPLWRADRRVAEWRPPSAEGS